MYKECRFGTWKSIFIQESFIRGSIVERFRLERVCCRDVGKSEACPLFREEFEIGILS